MHRITGDCVVHVFNTAGLSWDSRALRFVLFVILAVCMTTTTAVCQPPATSLTTEEIVTRMAAMDAERTARSAHYRAVRHYTLDYKGIGGEKHAEMIVDVVANPPDKQLSIVSESGSKFLLDRVLHKVVESEREAGDGKNRHEVKLNAQNYDFQLIGMQTVHERPCYVLHVEPKRSNKFLYRGNVCVDAEDFAVAQISASPAKNPSFWTSSVEIQHEYEKQGDAWLPRRNQSSSKVRLGGRALLTIDYERYELTDQAVSQARSR